MIKIKIISSVFQKKNITHIKSDEILFNKFQDITVMEIVNNTVSAVHIGDIYQNVISTEQKCPLLGDLHQFSSKSKLATKYLLYSM